MAKIKKLQLHRTCRKQSDCMDPAQTFQSTQKIDKAFYPRSQSQARIQVSCIS